MKEQNKNYEKIIKDYKRSKKIKMNHQKLINQLLKTNKIIIKKNFKYHN